MGYVPTELHLAEYATATHHLIVPPGVSAADVTEPSFWAHVTRAMRPGGKIEVLAADMSWWGLFLVLAGGKNEAFVTPLHVVQVNVRAQSEPDEFAIQFRGPRRFSIVRVPGGDVVEEDIATKAEALQRLANRLKVA